MPIMVPPEETGYKSIINRRSYVHRCQRNRGPDLEVVSCNLNGVAHIQMHFKRLLGDHKPEIIFVSETKRHKVVNLYSDMGDEEANYRAVQIRSTNSLRGGMVAMINLGIQVETSEIVRIHSGK